MGIFDGVLGGQGGLTKSEKDMYDNHMEHIRVQESEMLRQKYEAQALMNQSHLSQLAQHNMYGSAIKGQTKPFNPNEDAAYTTPLSQLVTLWQANYGDKWVEVFDDEFWASARVRLHNNDKLEAVSGWFRIKEDA